MPNSDHGDRGCGRIGCCVPEHDFVRHPDDRFGVALGGGCGERHDGVTCGWPASAHAQSNTRPNGSDDDAPAADVTHYVSLGNRTVCAEQKVAVPVTDDVGAVTCQHCRKWLLLKGLVTAPNLSKQDIEQRMRLISRTLDPAERDRMYADLEREMGAAPCLTAPPCAVCRMPDGSYRQTPCASHSSITGPTPNPGEQR